MGVVNVFKGLDLQKEIYNFNGSIRANIDLNWDYAKIYKGSEELDPDYQARDDDIIVIQEFPQGTGTGSNGWDIAFGILTGGIYTSVISYNQAKQAEDDMKDALDRIGKGNKQKEVSSIPMLSGGRNESASGKNPPVIIGRHLFAPYFLSDPYLRPGGADGKDLYWHAAFIAGQNGLCFENKRNENPCGIRNGMNELVTNFRKNTNGDIFQDDEAQYGKFFFDKPADYAGNPNKYNPNHKDYDPPPFYDPENFVEIAQGNYSFTEEKFREKWVDSLDSTVELGRKKNIEELKELPIGELKELPIEELKDQVELLDGDFLPDNGPDPIIRETARFPMRAEIEIFIDGLYGWDSKNGKETPAKVGVKIEWSADGETWPNKPLKLKNLNNLELSLWQKISMLDKYGEEEDGVNYIIKAKSEQMRFLAEIDFPPDIYTKEGKPVFIRAARTTKMRSSGYVERVYLSAIRTKQYNPKKSSKTNLAAAKNLNEIFEPDLSSTPVRENKFCRIGIKIKVNKNTQEALDRFNAVASMTARTWDGRKWGDKKTKTSNPAAAALEILTGLIHNPSKYKDDEINAASFGRLYEYCQNREVKITGETVPVRFDLEANGVLTNGTKKLDILKSVLAVCDAGLYVDEFGKYHVYYDDRQSVPLALLNPQRIVKINEQRSLERKTDGYTVEFVDQEADWSIDAHKILRPGVAENPGLNTHTSIRLDYTTSYYQAMWHARRMMAKEIHRPGELKITVGKEGRLYKPGSLIKVQHEGLKIGLGSGEITRVIYSADGKKINGFKLMEKFYIGGTGDYFVEYYVVDGNRNKVVYPMRGRPMRLQNTGKYTDTLTLTTPLPADDLHTPDMGNILSVLYGDISEYNWYVVSELSENNDGYDITLFHYDDEIYNTTSIDEIKPYISHIQKAAPTGYSERNEAAQRASDHEVINRLPQMMADASTEVVANKTPGYRGVLSAIDDEALLGIVSGERLNANDWVSYMGPPSGAGGVNWIPEYCYRWARDAEKGFFWEQVPYEEMDKYMAAVTDMTRDTGNGRFENVFCRLLWAQKGMIDELQTKVIVFENFIRSKATYIDPVTGVDTGRPLILLNGKGEMEAINAKFENINVTGKSTFHGDIYSGSLISTNEDTPTPPTPTVFTANQTAFDVWLYYKGVASVTVNSGSWNDRDGIINIGCKTDTVPTSGGGIGLGGSTTRYTIEIIFITGPSVVRQYAANKPDTLGGVLRLGGSRAGKTFILKDIPNNDKDLGEGQLYTDPTNNVLRIKRKDSGGSGGSGGGWLDDLIGAIDDLHH